MEEDADVTQLTDDDRDKGKPLMPNIFIL